MENESKMTTLSDFEIDPVTLKEMLDRGEKVAILDVREPYEHQLCTLPDSHLIPLGELPHRIHELNSADFIVALCHRGVRSARACDFFAEVRIHKSQESEGGESWPGASRWIRPFQTIRSSAEVENPGSRQGARNSPSASGVSDLGLPEIAWDLTDRDIVRRCVVHDLSASGSESVSVSILPMP
jgi:adenylyltransferase/sulfurtransferase